jgi:hypothetical protein
MTPELKEKLLLAAKAAGYATCTELTEDDEYIIAGGDWFEPHLSFCDAARLAFDCGMKVDYNVGSIWRPIDANWCSYAGSFIPGDHASFCLAVVEAAAEMGRKK